MASNIISIGIDGVNQLLNLRENAGEIYGLSAHANTMIMKSTSECKRWARADQKVLSSLCELGWLDQAPDVYELDEVNQECHSFSRAPGPGWIAMATSCLGDPWWPVSLHGDHDKAILVRLFTLLHETGHTVGGKILDPLITNKQCLSGGAKKEINTWILGPYAGGRASQLQGVYAESFADVWALTVLLEISDHHPSVQQLATEVAQWRERQSIKAEQNFDHSTSHHSRAPFGGIHHTQGAIKKMLSEIGNLKNANPETFLEKVKYWTSESWLSIINPLRKNSKGLPQGVSAKRMASGDEQIDPSLAVFWRALCLAQEPGAWNPDDHPLLNAVNQVWPDLLKGLGFSSNEEISDKFQCLSEPTTTQKNDGVRHLVTSLRQDSRRWFLQHQSHPAVIDVNLKYDSARAEITSGWIEPEVDFVALAETGAQLQRPIKRH